MQIIRFRNDRNVKMYGFLYEKRIRALQGDIFNIFSDTGIDIKADKVKILAPVPHPNKIIGIGLNYKKHVKEWAELNNKKYEDCIPKVPLMFLKPPTARIGQNGEIEIPAQSQSVEYEGELAVVMGKQGRNIPKSKAFEHIFGYTCANDVTARDIQIKEGQWTRAKGFDSFCPLGPGIVLQKGFKLASGNREFIKKSTKIIDNPDNLSVKTYLNGKIVQDFNTNDMIFSVSQLVEAVSEVMTLFPGDVILTGTSLGVGKLNQKDVVEVEIEKIGRLVNKVIKS